jgi:N-acetylmuramoyl-L-alanine amidase-like protein/Big-like domain-containing protein
MRRFLAALVGALALCPPAVAAPELIWIPASPANYRPAHRPARTVRVVVVHSVEGTYWRAIAWFRNPRAHVSANYVVGRDGSAAQMVSERDIAWHAGNGWVNAHSVGIENEGYAFVPWTFTDAEYRSSAAVAAAVLRRGLLPIDRRHVIGHSEVPDPRRPWLGGGYSHHRDPGPYWDWRRYMAYVRAYARGDEPAPWPLDVVTSLGLAQTVKGTTRWEAYPNAPVARADFLVDGVVRASVLEQPYTLDWDTTLERNGSHRLQVRAVATDGAVARAGTLATVANPPLKVIWLNLFEGQIVAGVVRVEAATSRPPQRVELLIDGQLRATATAAPYAFEWDTSGETDGAHLVTVQAVRGYAVSARTVLVVVERPPAP